MKHIFELGAYVEVHHTEAQLQNIHVLMFGREPGNPAQHCHHFF